jgi:hypothetical protein
MGRSQSNKRDMSRSTAFFSVFLLYACEHLNIKGHTLEMGGTEYQCQEICCGGYLNEIPEGFSIGLTLKITGHFLYQHLSGGGVGGVGGVGVGGLWVNSVLV